MSSNISHWRGDVQVLGLADLQRVRIFKRWEVFLFSSNCEAVQTSSLVGHAHARGRHLQMVSDQNAEYRLTHSCHICIMQSTPRDLANLYESISVRIKLSKSKAVCTIGSRTLYPLKNISQNASNLIKQNQTRRNEMQLYCTTLHEHQWFSCPHNTEWGRKRG